MKTLSIVLNTILICVLVSILATVGLPNNDVMAAEENQAPAAESTTTCDSSRTIHVSGTAVVNVTPDRVLIQLGVQSNGRTPQLTEAVNSATVYRVIQAINTDALTGLYNRAFFDSQFTIELERARRTNNPLTLVIADLDHFKTVNDQLGHHAGDTTLQMVARRLQEELRRIDLICRIGGEEFALVLPDTSLEAGKEVMSRLLNAPFCEGLLHEGERLDLTVTFSFGAVTFPEAGSDAFELYRKADAMLYLSKDLGRNQCHFWNSEGDHQQLLPGI